MWNYEKRLQYPVKNHKNKPKNRTDYTLRNMVGPDGGIRRIYEISLSTIHDAI